MPYENHKFAVGARSSRNADALALKGDTVELKTGERLDGVFRQAGTSGVVIEIAGQAMTVPLGKVQAIYFGAPPKASSVGSSPYLEALDALRGLRSITEAGVSYRDYAPHVLDAKIQIDRWLSTKPSDPAGNLVSLAIREYNIAAKAWSATITNDFYQSGSIGTTILADSEISKCPSPWSCSSSPGLSPADPGSC